MKILQEQYFFIVDDDELTLKSMKRVMEVMGYKKINTYNNGYDCILNLTQKPFAVLLDYHMEGLSGFDVLQKIKKHYPETYVIMFSSQSDVESAIQTLRLGAFDYIVKSKNDGRRLAETLERVDKIEENKFASKKSLLSKLISHF